MINRCNECQYCKENIKIILNYGSKKYYVCENKKAFSSEFSIDGESLYIEEGKEAIIPVNFGCIHFKKGE